MHIPIGIPVANIYKYIYVYCIYLYVLPAVTSGVNIQGMESL